MYWRDVVTLKAVTEGRDADGFPFQSTLPVRGATAGVRTRARAVAEWLSGEGLLVFDDEPEKAYSAKVVGGISIEQIAVTGTCEVRFLCKPFAESLRYNQQDVKSVSLPHTEAVNVRGTQETDGLIYITARGNIQTLTITRLKVN